MAAVSVRGRKVMVIRYPTTSSITILGLSFPPKINSARSAAHQARKKVAAKLKR